MPDINTILLAIIAFFGFSQWREKQNFKAKWGRIKLRTKQLIKWLEI